MTLSRVVSVHALAKESVLIAPQLCRLSERFVWVAAVPGAGETEAFGIVL